MKLPSLRQTLQEARATLKRFPVVLAASVIGTVAALVLVEYEGPAGPTLLFPVLLASILAKPLLLALGLMAERRGPANPAALGLQLLVQAVTEFLPISSSAHLILARLALDFDVVDGLTFDVAVHLGTLAAVVVYFRHDLRALARGFMLSVAKRSPDADPFSRMSWYVIAACIPAGIVGFFFESAIEVYFRHPGVIVVTMLAGAFLRTWLRLSASAPPVVGSGLATFCSPASESSICSTPPGATLPETPSPLR